ncbi:pyrroloquinoline quinone biosynthesis protein PqqE [Rhodoligotrophos appendicifer]|uniref:pyrroloquinoline quinone biosynthesis protein PqqE n=1 Tax=Rhodoligotrophos appendicifer TaxID=987056 RepID=UPI0011859EA4|nr:pyrroloquinoline quinone biosynthesis protein PqqE [Rhodoligotrophos appendicifer]
MRLKSPVAPPTGMLAELTHRCPLRCPYCSNPLDLDRRSKEIDTKTWCRVFSEAAEIGVIHVHLSGGEPTSRSDLEIIVAHCHAVGLYTNLITSGISVDIVKLEALAMAGLDHVQLSMQDTRDEVADVISGLKGSHHQKLGFAKGVIDLELPLTINTVIHRRNIDKIEEFVGLAVSLGARRIEIAHAQYYGWALKNRDALMPTREQTIEAVQVVERLRAEYKGVIVIDAVVPDYYARYPKPCMGGWGRQSLNVTPVGKVLPCHAAETIKELEFWSVIDYPLSDIWERSPAFSAFRGTGWMREPCSTCARREIDWGGCRCQALSITGSAREADPACHLSKFNPTLVALAESDSVASTLDYQYREFAKKIKESEA